MLNVEAIGDAIVHGINMAMRSHRESIDAAIAESLSGIEQRTMQMVSEQTKRFEDEMARRFDAISSEHATQFADINDRMASIPAGKDGVDGKDGAAGVDGKDGIDGKDALEIQIIDIDPQKSYPRGTVAMWAGGLIRADRRTGPITGQLSDAGWRVILRGVSDTDVVPGDDGRTLTVRVTHTDGEVVERSIRSPALIYREVYREGEKYLAGDAVTWGGSLWIALTDTTTKPGTDDWRLAVKKGRDGKDAGK